MRRILLAIAIAWALAATSAPAQAAKRPGIAGTILNTTCPGPCVYPAPPAPPYTGSGLTVQVRRVSDGAVVATIAPSDGHFRVRVKRGSYDVSAAVSDPAVIQPAAAPLRSCWHGDTQRVRVYRHRLSYVELHMQNTGIL